MIAYLADLDSTRAKKTAERHMYGLAAFGRFIEAQGVGDMLDVLSRDSLRKFYVWLRDPKTSRHGTKQRSLNTSAKIVEVVECFWQWLSDSEEFEPHTPAPKTLKDLPEDPDEHQKAPTWFEMDACAAHAGGWYSWLAICLRMSGLRVEATMLLDVPDFDLDAMTLNFRGEIGKSRQERRGRLIPISQHWRDLIRFGLHVGYLSPEGPLVPTTRTERNARSARADTMAEAWQASGVREEAWRGARKDRPHHAFRAGFQSELKRSKGDIAAIDFLVGHDMPGVQDRYIDPDALPLRATVGLVPPLDIAAATRFIQLAQKRRGAE